MRPIAGLVLAGLLAGCQAPGLAPRPATAPVQARLAPAGYALMTVRTAYTAASIDHVRLTLLANASGSYQATGATTSIPATGLAGAINLGNLKIGRGYRVQADAYSAAAESSATLISDPAASVTDFTTPAVTTSGGVASVDDTPVSLVALKLRLLDQIYFGSGTFTVSLSSALKTKVTTVTVTLSSGGTTIASKSYPVGSVTNGATVTMTNLKLNTTYKLQADGYDSKNTLRSVAANSTVGFTTPAIVNNQVDDAIPAQTIPCR